MKKWLWLLALTTTVFMLMVLVSPVAADDPVPVSEDDVNEIAEQLYCPVCENVPLDVCPTKACIDWRTVIREMLEDGKSKDEIIAHFSTQYGWSVLPMPPRVGLNWLIYVLPPLIIFFGGIMLIALLRKSKNESRQINADAPSHGSQNFEDYLAIIDRDLKDNENHG